MRTIVKNTLICAAAMTLAAPAAAATNIIPGNWTVISWPGFAGVLRAGSPWGPGSTPSSAVAPASGTFQPTAQQWNKGSFWWDQDASVNASPVTWTIQLNQLYTINQFKVQADDNDSYLLEYWTGSAWANAFNIAAVGGFGLQTRDSGILGVPITTNRLRFSAVSGDNYYSLGQLAAFGNTAVPEPATWAMLILGFGVIGVTMRRRQRHATKVSFV